jgi:hypothetical protein
VATSRDLVHWTKHGLAFGRADGGRFTDLRSKSGAIVAAREGGGRVVAVRIGGKYWMYWGESFVFAATSENLVDWTPVEREDLLVEKPCTSFKVVVSTRRGRFGRHVERDRSALVTPRGILLLHNASNDRDLGDPTLPDGAHAGGQVLLDPVDPTVVLARATEPFFRPLSVDETTGPTANVALLEGLVFFQGRWLLYYGMADSRISVAGTGRSQHQGSAIAAEESPGRRVWPSSAVQVILRWGVERRGADVRAGLAWTTSDRKWPCEGCFSRPGSASSSTGTRTSSRLGVLSAAAE